MFRTTSKIVLGSVALMAAVTPSTPVVMDVSAKKKKVQKKRKGSAAGKGMPDLASMMGGAGGMPDLASMMGGGKDGMPDLGGLGDLMKGIDMEKMMKAMGGEDGMKKLMENFGKGKMPSMEDMDMGAMNEAMTGVDKEKMAKAAKNMKMPGMGKGEDHDEL